eukprot:g47989.t1
MEVFNRVTLLPRFANKDLEVVEVQEWRRLTSCLKTAREGHATKPTQPGLKLLPRSVRSACILAPNSTIGFPNVLITAVVPDEQSLWTDQ